LVAIFVVSSSVGGDSSSCSSSCCFECGSVGGGIQKEKGVG